MIRLTRSLILCWLMILLLAAGGGCGEESETPPREDVSEEPLLPPTEPPLPPAEADDTEVTPLEGAPPPDEGASQTARPADARIAEFEGFRAPKPVTWTWRPPAGTLRIANYTVPGQDGSDQAEVVVFAGIVGTPDQNVTRWVQQFSSPDGTPVEPTITMHEADGMPVHVVELSGTYQGVGVGIEEDQLFLGAIVEAPGGDLHIRFVGPYATVDANREAFLEFVTGLERID